MLSEGDRLLGMFTMTATPRMPAHPDFPPAHKPAQLSRLAVAPELLAAGSLTGVRCVRKAIAVASALGADVLRSEANPDLQGTRQLLDQLGFFQQGPVHTDESGRRFVYLQKTL
ncbi:hypothetical protein DY218_11215 [Streptomyces triticagri]|uniref:N-acetyltransferase n=1 Tax=Streptomyces triticagri TaxID=2293568 RepID=A0A372M8L5_9ACTN|nr:hypothetical protein DY218_11215 [Streptomyces triticagri]